MPQTVVVPPAAAPVGLLSPSDTFAHRHLGPSEAEIAEMLEVVGTASLNALADRVVPRGIRLAGAMGLEGLPESGLSESEALARLKGMMDANAVRKSMLGMGYSGTITPGVILRNILENPGWYTQYTPYQAEIAQGRLEALLNFQTMVSDLTQLPVAGASLLDEATAAAEAIAMCHAAHEHLRPTFLIASDCHPQTLEVCAARASGLGIDLRVVAGGMAGLSNALSPSVCGVLVQTPATDGTLHDVRELGSAAKEAGALLVVATDLLSLTLATAPGMMGADVAVGSAQRLGVPMGFGGPHAAFIATREEHVRRLPGRIIGVSKDAQGNRALRMAIQTREQHIRRDKATSNICTAQALLAIIAGMYACYHGPEGLRRIALRAHSFARLLAASATRGGHTVLTSTYFDTITIRPKGDAGALVRAAKDAGYLLRLNKDATVGIACDETTTLADARAIAGVLGGALPEDAGSVLTGEGPIAGALTRKTGYLTHPVFNSYHSEHEMLRYIFTLMGRDLSLTHSMIPLGSCTMKLNATSEMIPVTWASVGGLHPFSPLEDAPGYREMFRDLERWLATITGFAAVSLQPNAGAAGEYAGLMVIRAYHQSRGEGHRTVCLIPESAHGTNPASAVMAGMKVVSVKNTPTGDVDLDDLKAKATAHAKDLAALMVTYPSTYGVFEEKIREICEVVHAHGGQVYMDGANMNAQVGLTSPGHIGADVCHLNLHKTFCIPHGGGGPGMGPIGVAKHLAAFLPGHGVSFPSTLREQGAGDRAIGAISAAPYGSASILPISWMYIAMMGGSGLTKATEVAILNANYMAKRLEKHYNVLYRGVSGCVAHEFILDVRPFDKSAGIKPDDIAKRLMDYGFHAPTMSWPVAGTLMVEPTESESKAELDRFCDAMIAIREEIRAIEEGRIDKASNPLKHAPHTMHVVASDTWDRPYSREQGAFPLAWVRAHKFWPSVGRVDNPFGDRNLVCTCPPMEQYV